MAKNEYSLKGDFGRQNGVIVTSCYRVTKPSVYCYTAVWGKGDFGHYKGERDPLTGGRSVGLKGALKELCTAQSRAARWITGLLPVRHQINKFMARSALRVCTLPANHPIRAWLPDYWKVNQHNFTAPFPMTSPTDCTASPLKPVDILGRASSEEFSLLHDECRPGFRLLDVFPDRIKWHLAAPHKSSDEFEEWYEHTFLRQ
ncbi:hypothetical protein K474DRAFT_1680750, partial [Panus rudis PR-1116 ss-1]